MLTKPEVKKFAIANPDHAPYGAAARDALKTAGLWDSLQPKIVYGENIRQTLQFAQTLGSIPWFTPNSFTGDTHGTVP